MAQTTPELEQIIRRFRKQLEKMGIQVEQLLLFGSQADGTAQEGSDIDKCHSGDNDGGILKNQESGPCCTD